MKLLKTTITGGFLLFVFTELLQLDFINALIITFSFFIFRFFAVRFNKPLKIFGHVYCSLIYFFAGLTTYQEWSSIATKFFS